MPKSKAEELAELKREVAAQGILLGFFVQAAPFINTTYYHVGRVINTKKEQTVVDGVVVAEREIGGTIAPRNFKMDLDAAIAEAERIRKGR